MKSKNVSNENKNDKKDMKMNYIEETLKFIESDEMRECLRACPKLLDRETCTEIVLKAPAPLEKKLPVLELIAREAEIDADKTYLYDPIILHKEIILALDERYNNLEGTIFRLFYCRCNQSNSWFMKEFITFDETLKFIKNPKTHCEEGTPYDNPEGFETDNVYKLTKWDLLENKPTRIWYLNGEGEILYYNYQHSFIKRFDPYYEEFVIEIPGRLNLPVPFMPGEIITVDCSPFAKERKVLVLFNSETENSFDGYSVSCLFVNKNNKLDEGCLKFNEFLPCPDFNYISGLYRAKVYDGELTKSEARLGIISKAIKSYPYLKHDRGSNRLGGKISDHFYCLKSYATSFPEFYNYSCNPQDIKFRGVGLGYLRIKLGF